jgi:hypothetical protein
MSNSRIFQFIRWLDNLKRQQCAFFAGNGQSPIDVRVNGFALVEQTLILFFELGLTMSS